MEPTFIQRRKAVHWRRIGELFRPLQWSRRLFNVGRVRQKAAIGMGGMEASMEPTFIQRRKVDYADYLRVSKPLASMEPTFIQRRKVPETVSR